MRARYVFLPALAVAALAFTALATEAPPSPRPSPAVPRATPAPPPVLEGSVRGPDGRPIEKALVIAVAISSGTADTTVSTRTDAQGRFRLDLKSRAKHRVRAEAAGLAGRTLKDVVAGAPLTIDLARGGRIDGVVRDGATGQPAGGVRVETSDVDAIGLPADPTAGRIEATTDGEGRFTLAGLGPGRHTLAARARGRGSASRSGVALGARVEMMLEPAATLFGVVSGPDGKPLAGATVTPLAVRSTGAPRAGPSDPQGRYELNGLAAGLYDVAVRAPGLAPAAIADVVLDGRDDVRVDVTLRPGARVTGRLVGADDKPLAGDVSIGELDGHPAPYVLADLLRAEAGADGRFAIDAVPVGAHALGANAPGLAPKRVELEVSATQRAVDLGDVRMETGLVIRGRVRTSAGDPIANAHVQGYASYSRTGRSPHAKTDEDGAFAMGGLEAVTYRLYGIAPGFARAEATVEPGPDPVELVLETGGAIAGKVVDDRGRAIESFRVIARPVQAGAPSGTEPFERADGRFVLEGLTPGAYSVTVEADERASSSRSATVEPGAPTDIGTITLGAGSTLRGTVVDAEGRFVAGARVLLRPIARETITTTFEGGPEIVSDRSGAFEAKGVAPGAFDVTAYHAAYARSAPVSIAVQARQAPPDVRLVLTQGGRIEGTYRRRDGGGMAGAFVTARPEGEHAWTTLPLTPVQPDGSFAIEHVPAGRVHVMGMTVTGQGSYRSAQNREIQVREGETTRLDIVHREILLTGRVTRAGHPAPGLRLEAQGSGMTSFGARGQTTPHATGAPERMHAVTREDGTFEMLVDEPGTIRMVVHSADQRFRLPIKAVVVPDVETHAVELSFDGVPVSGTVVDEDTDAPIPLAGLASTGGVSATAGQDGRFQLELAPGEHHLNASAHEKGYSHGGVRIDVGPAGLVDVRVPLARGLHLAGRITDPSGRGVAGVRVHASALPRDTMGSAVTLADGSFEIRGLKNADHRVTAWSDAGYFAIRPSVGAGTTDLALRMQPAARIMVQVVNAEGQPLAGVKPSVGNVDGAPNMWGLGLCRQATDAQGRTELLAPAGRILILAGTETLKGYTSIEVAPGATTSARIVVEPPPAHQTARGPQ